MDETDYPALYQAADKASLEAQRAFINFIKGYAVLSVTGAGLATYGIESRDAAIVAAVLFGGGLFITTLLAVKKYEHIWYRARAIAESIKTTSWRFVTRAEPYSDARSLSVVKREFTDVLRRILNEHKDLAHALDGSLAESEQITQRMLLVRNLPLKDRIQVYRDHRINEQKRWYAGKSTLNKSQGRIWFVALVTFQGAAIIFTLLRIAHPEWRYWPTEVFTVAAASALGWIQVKRFRELNAAYALAAHEIGLASTELEDITSEEEFSQFVGDTENAFSREHTQWAARRDTQ
jgi:hypothetical protein